MNLLDKLNKTVENVTQKTSEATGVSKVKLDFSLKNNAVRDEYRVLGEEVYDCYNSGKTADEMFADVCIRITALKEAIRTLEASVAGNID